MGIAKLSESYGKFEVRGPAKDFYLIEVSLTKRWLNPNLPQKRTLHNYTLYTYPSWTLVSLCSILIPES